MVKKFTLACLLVAVFAIALDLAESGKPTPESTSDKIQNFWPDKCEKTKGRRSAQSNSESLGSGEEKKTLCKKWQQWKDQYAGTCKVSSACAVLVINKLYGFTFRANRLSCSGDCPAGSICDLDANFCANNPGSFACQNAYTENGQLKSVFVCKEIPTTTTTATTTTTQATTTTTFFNGGL